MWAGLRLFSQHSPIENQFESDTKGYTEQMVMNFLISCVIIGISRKTLHHGVDQRTVTKTEFRRRVSWL
jgi:hypothetical protein